jgi:formyl-CoA transferase
MGMPERAQDPRYATNAARMERRDEVVGFIGAWTATRTKRELIGIFGNKVPFGPVFQADDIFADPHFVARDMLVDVVHPGADRALTIANTPIRMSRTPGGVRRRAPLTGEHTDGILAEFGFTPAEVDALRAAGTVA